MVFAEWVSRTSNTCNKKYHASQTDIISDAATVEKIWSAQTEAGKVPLITSILTKEEGGDRYCKQDCWGPRPVEDEKWHENEGGPQGRKHWELGEILKEVPLQVYSTKTRKYFKVLFIFFFNRVSSTGCYYFYLYLISKRTMSVLQMHQLLIFLKWHLKHVVLLDLRLQVTNNQYLPWGNLRAILKTRIL